MPSHLRRLSVPFVAGSFCAVSLFAAPVLPGYLTDPSANWSELTPANAKTPDSLKYPYVSVYYVKPTLVRGERATIRWFATDFDHSLVRFGDTSRRFDVELKLTTDRKTFRTEVKRNVSSGDGAFDLGVLPVGSYFVGVKCRDRKNGLDSHTVWQEFRVVEKSFFDISPKETLVADDALLSRYGICSGGDVERICPIEMETDDKNLKKDFVDTYLAAHPHADAAGRPGYAVYVPARKGVPVNRAFAFRRVVYDKGYDRTAAAAVAEANSLGLQRLLDEAVSNGFRKVVMKKGVYRVSHKSTLSIPDRFTFDLNGATLKLNGHAGCSAMMVKLAAVTDSHLVNGTLEGDYYEHDYEAKESKASEWVNGFNVCSMSRYSSVENVNCINVTGYGGCVGSGKEGPQPDAGCPYKWLVGRDLALTKNGPFTSGALDPKTGKVNGRDQDQWASGLVDVSSQVPWNYLQIGRFGGYQGNKLNGWCYAAAFYDATTNFISGEIAHQFRHVLIPAQAKFLRISVGATNATHAAEIGPVQTLKWPRNCSIERCRFDRCRAVGIAPNHMSNFLFGENEVSHSGESLATCGFDAEDGWDCMQDVLLRGNKFHDNPNNDILTCAGMNFQFVGNHASIYLWPRTYSSSIASNDCTSLHVGIDSRLKSGYVRLEGNRVQNLSLGGKSGYRDWDFAVRNRTFDAADPHSPHSVSGGPCGRFSHCTFRGVDARVAACESCVFENTFVKAGALEPNGRWTDCLFTNSRFSAYLGSMLFVRTAFPGSVIGSNQCKMRFVDCDLTDNKFGKEMFEKQTFVNCKGLPRPKLEDYIGDGPGKVPGAVIIDCVGGKLTTKCLGLADVAAKKPMTVDTVGWLASNTKAIACALVLSYVEEGRLALDAPVSRYLPEWKGAKVPTLRQCMSHTSGLKFFPGMPIDRRPVRELARLGAQDGQVSAPGEKYQYSNWGIDVAVACVEVVAGAPWEALLKKRILDPLDMHDATFFPSEEQYARLAKGYVLTDDKPAKETVVDQFQYPYSLPSRYPEAGGGLFGSPMDMIKFFAMVANGGVGLTGKRVLKEKTVALWFRKQTPDGVGERYSFGAKVSEGGRMMSHGGAWSTWGCAFRASGAARVFFVQYAGGESKGYEAFRSLADKAAETSYSPTATR